MQPLVTGYARNSIPTTFESRVSFSPVRECVEAACGNRRRPRDTRSPGTRLSSSCYTVPFIFSSGPFPANRCSLHNSSLRSHLLWCLLICCLWSNLCVRSALRGSCGGNCYCFDRQDFYHNLQHNRTRQHHFFYDRKHASRKNIHSGTTNMLRETT